MPYNKAFAAAQRAYDNQMPPDYTMTKAEEIEHEELMGRLRFALSTIEANAERMGIEDLENLVVEVEG